VAGGVTGAIIWMKAHAPLTVEQQLSTDSLRDLVNHDDTDKLLALATSKDLTDAQRDLMRRNMMEIMEGEMDRRINEYWAAPESDRQAVLDKHIDEMVERAPKWMEAMRKMREAEREKEKDANSNGDGSNGNGGERRRGGWGRGGFSKEQQRQRVEGRTAESQMKRMSYMAAAWARANDRGVRLPMMHGPGGGPGGGGWGGGGRGPGGGGGGGGRGPRN
jgi:hypothetical protein